MTVHGREKSYNLKKGKKLPCFLGLVDSVLKGYAVNTIPSIATEITILETR